MSEYLPKDVRDALYAAPRGATGRHRMRLEVGGVSFAILRHWPGGFSVAAAAVPPLPGRVRLYDGARHVSDCLIEARAETTAERVYDVKAENLWMDRAPRDFDAGATLPD